MKSGIFCIMVLIGGGLYAQVPSTFNAQVEAAGAVYAIARQANGQIIIGGSFERVNGIQRENIARLNADGTLDVSWNPVANHTVKAVAVSGTNIIVGGYFTNIGGRVRNRVAALDYYTGQALPSAWVQGANAEVRALAINGTAVFVGGVFTQIAGSGRARLARLDLGGNVAAAFTNGANDSVNCLSLLGTNLLVGGDFDQIGGISHGYLLKVSGWSGAALPWNGRPNSSVLSTAFDGTNLFVGGYFSSVSSTARVGVARLNSVDGNLDAGWNAELTNPQYVAVVANDTQSVYIAGLVTNLGGQLRENFARVSLASGSVSVTWSNNPDNNVNAITVSGTNILLGGNFSHIGTNWASAMARLLTNGDRDVSFPSRVCDPGIVYCIATQSGGRILIGGAFESVDGVALPGSARFLDDGSLDMTWRLRADGAVRKIILSGTNVYLAGTFSRLGSRDCYGVGKVSDQNGALLTGWTNRVRGTVLCIASDATNLYVGGTLTNINGQTFRYLARFRHSNHQVDTGWVPVVSNTVFAMAADQTHLYLGGAFHYLDAPVSNLARMVLASGHVDTSWLPNPNDSVYTVACEVSNVYVAGYFNRIGGQNLSQFTRVRKAGAGVAEAGWEPGPSGRIEDLYPLEKYIYVGGSFLSVGGESVPYLARLIPQTGNADPTWKPEPDFAVYTVYPREDDVLAGGLFSNIGGMRRLAFAQVEPFGILGLAVVNRIPVLTWRGGSNRTYAVDFIADPTYPYVEVTNGLSGDGEIQTFVDPGRFNYPRLFYRVWVE
ncbi:MAG: hypothetical protein V2A34_00140 [Lentisphaerota bacterium]